MPKIQTQGLDYEMHNRSALNSASVLNQNSIVSGRHTNRALKGMEDDLL